MKPALIRISIILSSLSIFACIPSNKTSENIKYRLTKLHYKNSTGENGVTIFEYNENGSQTKAVWKLLDGTRNSLNYYSYDENGKRIEATITQKEQRTGTISYTYDENDNLYKEYWDFSGKWSQTFTYEYEKII